MAMEESLLVTRFNPFHRPASAATTSTASDPDGAPRSHAPASWFGAWAEPAAVATSRPVAQSVASAAAIVIHDDAPQRRRAAAPSRRASPVERSVDDLNLDEMDLGGLPPYPDHVHGRPRQTEKATAAPPRPLLQEFPAPGTRTASAPPSVPKGDDATFPGFALFEMARAQQRLGRHSEALGTTAECLTLQRERLGERGGGAVPTPGSAGEEGAADANLTALDLRTSFVTDLSSSVLGMLKGSATRGHDCQPAKGRPPHPSLHLNQRLFSSSSTLASQYPLHPCVARTLLLRGRLLA